MSEANGMHEVPEGWPESARWDESVWNALRRLTNIKELIGKMERVLLDPDVCRAAATGPITSRNLRAMEAQVGQVWGYELHKFEAQIEAKRAEQAKQAERERKVAESGREAKQKVTEWEGERLRYVCGRIDLDLD